MQLPASPAQHAVTEFKWASGRYKEQARAVPASFGNRTASDLITATTAGSLSRAGSNPSAAATPADSLTANGFKWISDYVDDSEGAI